MNALIDKFTPLLVALFFGAIGAIAALINHSGEIAADADDDKRRLLAKGADLGGSTSRPLSRIILLRHLGNQVSLNG